MNHIWDNWSDGSSEEELEELLVERRQYKMLERIDVDKWDDSDFAFRFRLSKSSVYRILEMIKISLEPCTERSRFIRPITQLLIALRSYALGSMHIAIADFVGVSIVSVCRIVRKVSLALAQTRSEFVKMPSTRIEMVDSCKQFYNFARFPRTIAAIDCTHVKIQSPGGNYAENYRNRKGWFSLNVQVACSANQKIANIVAWWPGASHDQTIFNNSNLKMKFEHGDFSNFILVGDSGYRNTMYLATPFLNCTNDVHQLYNESQIRTRNVIERTFGLWKRRFPILSMGMRMRLSTVQTVIVACAILHNIAIDEGDILPPVQIENFEEILAASIVQDDVPRQSRGAANIRDTDLISYFRSLE